MWRMFLPIITLVISLRYCSQHSWNIQILRPSQCNTCAAESHSRFQSSLKFKQSLVCSKIEFVANLASEIYAPKLPNIVSSWKNHAYFRNILVDLNGQVKSCPNCVEKVKKFLKYFSYIHVKLIDPVKPWPNCVEAVKKMSSCPACKGLPEVIIIFCFLLKIYFC